MLCIAIEKGYDGLVIREPVNPKRATADDVFEMPEGSSGSWFVECDADGTPKVKVEEKPKPKKGEVPGAGPKPGSQTNTLAGKQFDKSDDLV